MPLILAERRTVLPPDIYALWPADFEELRKTWPRFCETASMDEIRETAARLMRVIRYYGQHLPPDLAGIAQLEGESK